MEDQEYQDGGSIMWSKLHPLFTCIVIKAAILIFDPIFVNSHMFGPIKMRDFQNAWADV